MVYESRIGDKFRNEPEMSGGKREGAGRPPLDPQLAKVPVGTKLPRWLVVWLRTQPNQAVAIEEALCQMHGLTPPDHEA